MQKNVYRRPLVSAVLYVFGVAVIFGAGFSSSPFGVIPIISGAISLKRNVLVEIVAGILSGATRIDSTMPIWIQGARW